MKNIIAASLFLAVSSSAFACQDLFPEDSNGASVTFFQSEFDVEKALENISTNLETAKQQIAAAIVNKVLEDNGCKRVIKAEDAQCVEFAAGKSGKRSICYLYSEEAGEFTIVPDNLQGVQVVFSRHD